MKKLINDRFDLNTRFKSITLSFLFLVLTCFNLVELFPQTTVSISPSNSRTVYNKVNIGFYTAYDDIVGSIFYDDDYRWYRKGLLFNLSQIPPNSDITSCYIYFTASTYSGSNNGYIQFAEISTNFLNWSNYDFWYNVSDNDHKGIQWISSYLGYQVPLNVVSLLETAINTSPYEFALGAWFDYEADNRGANFFYPRLVITYTPSTPPSPTGITINSETPGSFILSWTSGGTPSATYYKVYKNDVEYGSTTTTEMKICGLSPSTTYQMRIVPYNDNGPGTSSVSIPGTTTQSIISGNYLLCSTGTYSINNPTGTTVTWSKTDNISIASGYNVNSNPIVFQKVSNGNGFITASVSSSNCENYSTSMNIHTGPYSSSDYSISGPSSAQCRSYVYYSISDLPGITSINWTWPSNWTYISGQGSTSLALRTGYSGSGIVSVGVNNTCGTSGSYATKYTSLYGYCGYSLIIYPNPATDFINVSIKEPESNSLNEEMLSNEYDQQDYQIMKTDRLKVTISDNSGVVYKTLNRKSKNFEITISDLKKGSYILTVTDGFIVLSSTLIVSD